MNMQQYYTLCVSTVLWSSEAFKIGELCNVGKLNCKKVKYNYEIR